MLAMTAVLQRRDGVGGWQCSGRTQAWWSGFNVTIAPLHSVAYYSGADAVAVKPTWSLRLLS